MKRFNMVNRGDEQSLLICETIKTRLLEHDFVMDKENPELVICVGGDGTLLKAFHDYLDRIDRTAFIGVHTGTLGFSSDYTQAEIDAFIYDLTHVKPIIDTREILMAECRNENKVETYYALNEVRVENIVKTQTMDVYIDDNYFETFRGNGLCISGQYGSTAYNRSIGGAVIYPGLDLLQMTEISGIHHRHARSLGSPLVMNYKKIIQLKSESFNHALLCYDHLHIHLDGFTSIVIRNSGKMMRFARYKRIPHIEKLNALF